jgi:hypothetical protein
MPNLEVDYNDRFKLVIGAEDLLGLRPSKRVVRNKGGLVVCEGAVGRDGALQALDELTRIATTEITDGFPYPQIFVFIDVIIVCGLTTIYEWVSSALVSKLVTTAGDPWSAVDFHKFIYLSNSKVAVVRDVGDGTYATTANLPIASSICDLNGQIIIGAPEVEMS